VPGVIDLLIAVHFSVFRFNGHDPVQAGECIVGKTIEMNGNSSINFDCNGELGNRKMYAGRTMILVK
jgi:hypothetical protein